MFIMAENFPSLMPIVSRLNGFLQLTAGDYQNANLTLQEKHRIDFWDHPAMPSEFQASEKKAIQGEIIESLVRHRPSDRPDSVELLRSGKLPAQVEDETTRLALEGLSDTRSPYYHKMLSALFTQPQDRQVLRDQLWDTGKTPLLKIGEMHGAREKSNPHL